MNELNSILACKIICCKPAQKYLKRLYQKWNWDKKAYKKIRKILIETEKICGVMKYFSYKVAVGVSLYLFSLLYSSSLSHITQRNIASLINKSKTTLQKYLKKIKQETEFRAKDDIKYHITVKCGNDYRWGYGYNIEEIKIKQQIFKKL
jgi:hypothetical protein